MDRTIETYGYYHITLASKGAYPLLHSNNERAFIVSQLQDLLSPRLVIGEVPAYRQLASCIDLLAFSIQRTSVQFVVFSIDETLTRHFTESLCAHLAEFQATYLYSVKTEPRVTIAQLLGPHQALAQTITMHCAHSDWEYDRYSSIGFYLHDRRGDWMRLWRMSTLYEHNSEHYRTLLTRSQDETSFFTTPQMRAA